LFTIIDFSLPHAGFSCLIYQLGYCIPVDPPSIKSFPEEFVRISH